MKARSSFGRFLGAIVSSLGVVLAGAVWHVAALYSILALVPLILYHLTLWRQSRSGLTEAEIDSVYYFGFLITVAELAASALDLPGAGESPKGVLARFAVGLAATGYAIIARMHLQGTKETRDKSLETTWDAYATRAARLLDNLDLAVHRIDMFVKDVDKALESCVETARKGLESSAAQVSEAFSRELARAAAASRETLEQVRAAVTDPALTKANVELCAELKETGSAASGLTRSLRTLVRQGEAVGQAFGSATQSSQSFSDASSQLSGQFDQLVRAQAALDALCRKLEGSAEAAFSASSAAVMAASGLDELRNAAALAAPAITGLASTMEDLGGGATSFQSSIQQLEGAAAAIREAASGSNSVAAGFLALNQEVPRLGDRLRDLSEQSERLAGDLGASGPRLQEDLEASTQLVVRLGEGLARLAELIIERTQERRVR